ELELYLGIYEDKLRYFTPAGELVQKPEESVLQERQQKEYERQQKEYERQQKELAQQELADIKARLKELDIEL
ncbi:MAG: Uma2 family endonuclease, partial [Xenococcus sp. (in: cyanobacteria)]